MATKIPQSFRFALAAVLIRAYQALFCEQQAPFVLHSNCGLLWCKSDARLQLVESTVIAYRLQELPQLTAFCAYVLFSPQAFSARPPWMPRPAPREYPACLRVRAPAGRRCARA